MGLRQMLSFRPLTEQEKFGPIRGEFNPGVEGGPTAPGSAPDDGKPSGPGKESPLLDERLVAATSP